MKSLIDWRCAKSRSRSVFVSVVANDALPGKCDFPCVLHECTRGDVVLAAVVLWVGEESPRQTREPAIFCCAVLCVAVFIVLLHHQRRSSYARHVRKQNPFSVIARMLSATAILRAFNS